MISWTGLPLLLRRICYCEASWQQKTCFFFGVFFSLTPEVPWKLSDPLALQAAVMQLVECTYIYCNTFLAQSLTLKHGSVITICTASSEQHRQHRHAALQALQQLQRRLQWLTKLKTTRNPNSGSFFDLPSGPTGYIQASNKQDSKTNMLNHLQTLFLKKNLLLAANIWSKKSEGHVFLF